MKISVIVGSVLMVLAAQNGVAGVSYPVVDTGQTVAYGDHKGQDAHYSANAPSSTTATARSPIMLAV